MKKAIHNFSKLLAWAFFGVALFSCSNASGGYDSSSSNRKSYPVVRFVANMQSYFAAAPQEISGLVSRSAMPDIAITAGDDGFKYYVEAVTGTPGKDSYIRHFVYGTTSTLELGLESGKTWNVTCGIGEIEPDSETPSDHTKGTVLTVLMSDNDPSVTITPDEPVYVKTFGLKPSITTDGTGTINLKLKIMYDTWYVKVSCSAQGWKDANGGDETVLLDGSKTLLLHIGSIKSGIYDVVFKFCDDKGALNYCTVQTINVFDDMTTSVWRDDGSGAVVTESGQTVFNVTESVIKLFTQTTMYVGDTGLGGLAPNNQNSGTAFEPLATLHEAAYRIKKYGQGADYTIFVSGTVQGCATFDNDITRDQAKTITIMGYNDSGDKLKGYASKLGNIVDFNGVTINTFFPESKEFNPVITVKTAVPITIQNVDICEGASNGGSGLCIDGAGCSVTIKDGVTISGNKTGKNGGGVLVVGGKFYMKGGKITGNSAFNSSSGNLVGGGVCLRSGAYFEMTGGEISLNRACYGGGVGLVNLGGDSGSNKFIFKRGKISQNTADGFVSGGSKCGYGGGIMIMSGSGDNIPKVTMTGGEISGNKVNFDSSAVEVSSSAAFTMTGGVIKDNGLVEGEEGSSNYSDISVSYGANYFCLGGSAYIPAGNDKKHRVHLNSLKNGSNPLQMANIDLSSNLSRHSQSDPLVIQFNESGAHAALRGSLVASASFDLTAAKEYIVPASGDWKLKLSSDKKSLVLDSPIWVAGDGAQQCTGTPSTTGPGTKSHPYDTIEHACDAMTDSSVEYTILIDGTLKAEQWVYKYGGISAAKINIEGANGLYTSGDKAGEPKDSIDGSSVARDDKDCMLSIDSYVDVTIKNLKITGGDRSWRTNYGNVEGGGIVLSSGKTLTLSSGTLITENKARQGGGVYVKDSTLVIEDGAKITKNTAAGGSTFEGRGGGVCLFRNNSEKKPTLKMAGGEISGNYSYKNGGGVFVDTNCYFFMYGNALIGADLPEDNIGSSDISSGCNRAEAGGGVFVKGYAYLGYEDANEDGSPKTPRKLEMGVIGNYAASSYNASSTDYHGGGVCLARGTDGAPILYMSSGLIAKNTANVGGAIYYNTNYTNYCKLTIGGDASIPSLDGEGMNDIYLAEVNKSISFANSLTKHGASNPITISLSSSWSQGKTVIVADPERVLTSDDLKCFKLSAEQEAAGLDLTLSSDNKSIKLDKPIFVKQGGTPSGSGTANGTKTKPYGSIEDACKKGMTSDSLDYTIKVIGNLEANQKLVNNNTSSITAKSITIMGADDLDENGVPQNAIIGGETVPPAAALALNYALPVTIKNLKITGGNNNASGSSSAGTGGGINSSKANPLTISSGTLISGNTAKQGAGIYQNGGKLVIEDGAVISGNTAVGYYNDTFNVLTGGGGVALANGAVLDMGGGKITGNKVENAERLVMGGGVVCLNSSKIFMYGSAVIGGVDASDPKTPTSISSALAAGGNVACGTYYSDTNAMDENAGAGIAVVKGSVYLGYKPNSSNNPVEATGEERLTGGVLGNYSSNGCGGGIYLKDSACNLNIANGNVSYNYAYSSGGGVYNAGSFTMAGGEIYGNSVTGSDGTGGGVANAYIFTMKGGKIYANDGGLLGGGVYQSSGSSGLYLSGDAVIGDSSKPNVAKQGGGIGCKENVASLTRIGWFEGSVRYNFTGGLMGNRATAGSGGAIYMNKSSKLYFYSGRISGNTASVGKGNGVYVHPEATAMEMRGYVRFDASDDIWLAPPESGDPKTITISNDSVSGLHPTDTGASGGTPADKTATITPGAYNPGDTILTGTGTLVSDNYDKFALAQDASDPSQTWILDSDGCIYGSQPVLAIDLSNGMTSQDRAFITGEVVGNGTEEHPYVLELGALDTLKFQIKGGLGKRVVHGGEGANNRINISASCTSLYPNYDQLYNLNYLGDGLKIQMVLKSNYDPSDHTNEVHVPFWVLIKKPQYFMGTPYTVDGSNVKFGDFPQTIKESDVNLSSTIQVQQQQDGVAHHTYYLGDDGSWYCEQDERGSTGYGTIKYSDGSTVGTDGSTSRWFKVEPIEWKLLNSSSGTRLLHAKNILEAMHFDISGYDYAGSVIRDYLNGAFLNSAFSPSLRDEIRETTVNGVTDKVYLFQKSTADYAPYFADDNARIRFSTDFAKATGAAVPTYSTGGGMWWTRDFDEINNVYCVNSDGRTNDACIPSRSDIGLAPAMWVKLY